MEEENGYRLPALLRKLNQKFKHWRGVKINIAVIGEAGCGKSTLINTLRGLKSDDQGAAKIDCNESTTEPTPYQHPNNSHLILWDLPGVGTTSFPKRTYLDQIKVGKYDFIMLLSNTRFTELDAWLAMEINYRFPESTLFFVRTRVDSDLAGINQSRRIPMSKWEQEAKIADMTKFACKSLNEAGIKSYQTFMINTNNPHEFEFRNLVDMFIKKVSAAKREAFILSETVLTNNVVNSKIEVLKWRIPLHALPAGLSAAVSNRETDEYLEIPILRSTIREYQRQLGIDDLAIENVADFFKCDSETIRTELNSKSDECLNNFKEFYKQYDKEVFSYWHYLPFIGKMLKFKRHQSQCASVLLASLQMCISDNIRLREIIRKRGRV